MATVNGTSGDDFVHVKGDSRTPPAGYNDLKLATDAADVINSGGGGFDIIFAGKGSDTINFGGDFTKRDEVDGGRGTDTVVLDGDYSTGVSFEETTLADVEKLVVEGGNSYALTSHDSTVGAGKKLTVDGKALGAHDSLVFNGAAETDGKLNLVGGLGDDSLTSGGGNDTIKGGSGADTLTARGGEDVVYGEGAADRIVTLGSGAYTLDGGSGDDTIVAGTGGTFDRIEGGTGDDLVSLHALNLPDDFYLSGGNGIDTLSIGSLIFGLSEFSAESSGFEKLFSNSFPIQGSESANVWDFSGLELIQDSSGVWLDGQGGADQFTATATTDTLVGGEGADSLTGGAASDKFVYFGASESTGADFDTLSDFDFTQDKIDLTFAVQAIDGALSGGGLSSSSFDSDLAAKVSAGKLGENHAVLYTPGQGDFAGQTFLIIDTGGGAGYQAGLDLVIALSNTSTVGSLDVGDFI